MFRTPRQEDQEFKVSLGYVVRFYLKPNKASKHLKKRGRGGVKESGGRQVVRGDGGRGRKRERTSEVIMAKRPASFSTRLGNSASSSQGINTHLLNA